MRLLLVEPHPQLAERLQRSLESEGYLVDLVGSLAEARKMVVGADYAAVLMDLDDQHPSTSAGQSRMNPDAQTDLDAVASLDVDIWFG